MSGEQPHLSDIWEVTYRCRECDYRWTVEGYGDGTDDPDVGAGNDECPGCNAVGEFQGAKRV